MEPSQLQQTDSSTTSILYYVEWEAPSNIGNIDLDHYQLYANDILVQRIHADQRYALISLQEGVTTTVKVAAVNKCGQVSNHSVISITSDPRAPQTKTELDGYVTTSPDVQTDAKMYNYTSGSQQSIASLIILACTIFLALLHRV